MEEPIERVRKSKEYKQRKEAGIDVEALLAAAMETDRYKKYKSPATRESILMAAIIPMREPPKGEDFDEELVVFSSHDRYGTKAPTKFVALRKNKTFCNIVVWDADIIKAPCKLRLVGKSTVSEYGMDVQPVEGGISAVTPMTFGELQAILNKVAITAKQWDTLESLVNGVKSETRAFRSTIGGVRATDVWGAKDAVTGKSSRVGMLPVLSRDERAPARLHPSMQVKLDYTGGFEVYANLNQQHFGSPVYQIEDFEVLCIDAMEQFLDDKDKQIEFVRSGIMGRDVYLIMDVFGNKAGRDDKRYITGSCSFIMEVIPEAAQSTIQTEEEPQPSSSSDHVENPFVEALVQACIPLDQDPKWVPVAKAREIASIGADVSDNLVQEMTKRASQVWNERKKA
ncbi:MAG: hypothetical protein PHS80_00270 [Methanothrix sp.]|nr:hypothetical protein [Methanothrix sp.]